jgi:general secretion pathway protein B
VIVDGNRLVEGDRIGDVVVTTITTDGVLLDWNGRRLKLPIR